MPRKYRIPFLRPKLVSKEAYMPYLERIDDARWYSNFGVINTLFEERVLAEVFGGRGAVTTTCNATIALMLAISQCRRSGRYALMPSYTFAATPLAAMWCGLEPWFVDISPGAWAMDEREVERLLARLGREVAVVVPYATFGACLPLDYYASLQERGIPVVIDAAPGFGAMHAGRQFGLGFPGTVVFSFHATKPFGIGEGGLVYSADVDAVERVRRASNFGFSPEKICEAVGLNGKMSEYTAAVALATLDAFSEKRCIHQRIYSWYREAVALSDLLHRGWEMHEASGEIPYQFLPLAAPTGSVRQSAVEQMAHFGIEVRTYFSPTCHQQPTFAAFLSDGLTVTEELSSRSLSLPFWEDMSERDVNFIVETLEQLRRT